MTEGTPAGGNLSATGHPVVDLTPAHTPPVVGETPQLPLPGAGPSPPLPRDAWGADEGPTLLATEDGPGALELVAEPRIPSGLTPPPAPRDTRAEASSCSGARRSFRGWTTTAGRGRCCSGSRPCTPSCPDCPRP